MKVKQIPLSSLKASLTCYFSEEKTEHKKTAIVIFPGGGYQYCSEREGEPIAKAYVNVGIHAFVLEYRTSNPFLWEEAWSDANEAMDMIHQYANEWGIDIQKIAVIGFSAGGHLASTLAMQGKIRPSAAILCYPVILESLAKLMSPLLHGTNQLVDKNTPPMFICSTFEDHVVPVRNTLCLIEELHKYKIPFECHIFEWGHHGLSLGTKETENENSQNIDERYATWFDLSVSWLKKQFDETNSLRHGKRWKENTIGDLMNKNPQALLNKYPVLENEEYLEALSRFTLEEFLEK